MTTHHNKKLITKSSTISLVSKKMPPNKKSKNDTKNSLNNFIPIKKPVMSKNSKNSTKPIKLSETPKKGECTISMEPKDPKAPAKTTSSTCSSEVEEEEEALLKNKSLKSNLPKKHSQSLFKTFIMEKLSKCSIPDQDAAKNVEAREDKTLKNANNAKEKVWSSKCTKWVQACINKFKNIAINVKEKDKLLLRAENVNNAKDKRFSKRKKLSKFQLKKVFQIITQLHYQEKVMKYLMLWQEILFLLRKNNNIGSSQEKALTCS